MPTNQNRAWDKSKKGTDYRNKYRSEHYAQINLLLSPEDRDKIVNNAEAQGLSRAQFIMLTVNEWIERNKGKGTE